MKKRKKYKPMPDDGLVNYHHCLYTSETVHELAQFFMSGWDAAMKRGGPEHFLVRNPDYYAAENLRKRKKYNGGKDEGK